MFLKVAMDKLQSGNLTTNIRDQETKMFCLHGGRNVRTLSSNERKEKEMNRLSQKLSILVCFQTNRLNVS